MGLVFYGMQSQQMPSATFAQTCCGCLWERRLVLDCTEVPSGADVSDLGTRTELRLDIATVWFASMVGTVRVVGG